MRSTSSASIVPGLPLLRHAAQSQQADGEARSEHQATLAQALSALTHIMDRELPADPRSFEIWYAYATGSNAGLNRAIDELVAQNHHISAADLETIQQRFFAHGGASAHGGAAGEKLAAETNQILAMLEAAIETAGGYQANLAGARRRLADADGREGIRAVVEGLVGATKDMEREHARLQASLRSSRQEIEGLKANLEATRSESRTDALTGLANRKHFDGRLARLITDSASVAAPLSLVMCDVDHFKRFNDTYGHLTGDHVLRLVANTIKQTVRGRDFAARYGGEEFAVILPETSLVQAAAVGENIRSAVARGGLVRRSTGESLGRMTLSVGVAQLRSGESAQALIERADRGLYAAKRQGRNRVVCEGEAG